MTLPRDETWSDAERRAQQRRRLERMLDEVLATNAFYRAKLGARIDLDDWTALPFTTKDELSSDQATHPPFGTNLTYPLERYVRIHQTSGTTGEPLRILDTAASWSWWADIWARIYAIAGVTSADRVYFCFSFGPFIGFWSALAGAERIGALAISGAALSSSERLHGMAVTGATVLLSTPTYALRLAEAARDDGFDPARLGLRVSIHAGEPGASIPATRDRIEAAFGVAAFDHTGATEVGPTGSSCGARDGVHVFESEFIAEVIDPATGSARDDGAGELVLTNLGRWGTPAIRYRTGDVVRLVRGVCACGRTLAKLHGGILGRVDDMVTVRGVNVFPSAVEAVVRRFDEISEFRVEHFIARGMDELRCIVETARGLEKRDEVDAPDGRDGRDVRDGRDGPRERDRLARRVAEALHRDIGIRCVVTVAPPGSLPRAEVKSRRFVRVG